MRAEILTIGDELCRGEVVDTNSSFFAAELWSLGIEVTWMTSCRDDAADMRQALKDAAGRADLVIVSGGLGPTEDDLTVDVLAEVCGVTPVTDADAKARLEVRAAKFGYPLTANNLRQVRVPAGARAFANPAGAAPGFEVKLPGGVPALAFPGVPRELTAIWHEGAKARVAELSHDAEKIARKVYRVFGVGESQVDASLSGLVKDVPGASLHYQVLFPETLVKLVVRGRDLAAAEATLAPLDLELRARLGRLIHAESMTDSLAGALGRSLKERRLTLAVAESCTGGMLGSLITDVPGSSAWFKGGWIVYSNEMKEREVGVRRETLLAHGAVSREVAEELARGARERAGADLGVAITGVAGPDGGSEAKPVGTVHIVVAGPGERMSHKLLGWPGARDMVRRLSSFWAMSLAMAALGEDEVKPAP